MSKNNKSTRNYKVKDTENGSVLEIYDKSGNKKLIPLIKYYGKWNYIALLPESIKLDGEIYPKGTIVVWNGPATEDDRSYTIVTDPKYDNKYYNPNIYKGWTKEGVPDIFNLKQITLDLRDINAEDFKKYTKFLKSNNTQDWIEKRIKSAFHPAPIGDTSGDTSGALTTEYDSSSPTDSATSTSFDFIDDILGTKSTDTEKGNTDYDPNEVANNTVSNSNLSTIRRDTVNELVLAYSKAMQDILDNYGKKDIYSLYSRDSI